MQKHFVHFVLILVLAVAPMQSVLAALAALEFASACPMLSSPASEHMNMSHNAVTDTDSQNSGMVDTQCDCCGDCLAICAAMSQPTLAPGSEAFTAQQQIELNSPRYTLAASSQYPLTDLRPPKVLH